MVHYDKKCHGLIRQEQGHRLHKKVIRDNGLQLHSRSAVMETYGAFSKDLWSL
eukprot:COSAG04_NODE_14738_length_557_cov_0.524017_1_plen_52_part_10